MLYWLVKKHIAAHPFLTNIVIGCLALGMMFCCGMVAMYYNAYHFYVDASWADGLGQHSFVLTNTPNVADGLDTRVLATWLLTEISWLSWIDDLYAFYTVQVPVSVDISYLGLGLHTDMQLYAASDNYFLDMQGSLSWVAVSQQLIDVYNLSLWGTSSLYPKLTNEVLWMLSLDFYIGQSSFFSYIQSVQRKERISFTDATVPLLGVTMPLSTVEEMLAQLWRGNIALFKVVGRFDSRDNFETFLQQYSRDYSLSYPEKRTQKIESNLNALKVLLLILSGFVLVIVVFFMMYVLASLLHKHKRLFFIFESMGAHWHKWLQFLLFEIAYYWGVASLTAVVVFIGIQHGIAARIMHTNRWITYHFLHRFHFVVISGIFGFFLCFCAFLMYRHKYQ